MSEKAKLVVEQARILTWIRGKRLLEDECWDGDRIGGFVGGLVFWVYKDGSWELLDGKRIISRGVGLDSLIKSRGRCA